jgi:hypothetical protein
MMIFNKARMAKLSGILTESKKGIKDSMADQFGGGKEEGDPWLDGEVTTEGAEEDEKLMKGDHGQAQIDDYYNSSTRRAPHHSGGSKKNASRTPMSWADRDDAMRDYTFFENVEELDEDEDMKEGDEEELDEASLRRMIRSALSEAKKEMMDKKKAKGKAKGKGKFPAKGKAKDDEDEEKAVREAVRSEIKSVLRSRGVTLGGTGPGFKR